MLGSVITNGLMGFAFAIMLLFSLGDLDAILASPTGFPFMQLFLNVTGSPAGATVLALFVSLVAVAANAAVSQLPIPFIPLLPFPYTFND